MRNTVESKDESTVETAVIIAGGSGIRLRPMTDDIPKTLVVLNGKPILYWIIKWLRESGIKRLVLGIAYKGERIIDYMSANGNFGLQVDFSKHSVQGGTAEAFKRALSLVDEENVIAMNSDELTNMNLKRMVSVHLKHKPMVTMALAPFRAKFSVATLDSEDWVKSFAYGPTIPEVPVSIGIYAFSSGIKRHIPPSGSMETLVFARLAEERRIMGYPLGGDEEWATINDLKELEEASLKIGSWNYVRKEPSE